MCNSDANAFLNDVIAGEAAWKLMLEVWLTCSISAVEYQDWLRCVLMICLFTFKFLYIRKLFIIKRNQVFQLIGHYHLLFHHVLVFNVEFSLVFLIFVVSRNLGLILNIVMWLINFVFIHGFAFLEIGWHVFIFVVFDVLILINLTKFLT